MIHSGLYVGLFQPTKLDMLGCDDRVSLESDLPYSLGVSYNLLPKCAIDPYFTYISKFSCILYTVSNDQDPISVCSTYEHHAIEAWYSIFVNLYLADWFDLYHRSSVKTLHLLLSSKTIYIFVHHRDHDYLNFTY
jgi:hypothetical protein